jgi:hypothetical protein
MKIIQLYEAKALEEIPMCPQERLVIISNTTGLSFDLERIGPLAAIIIIVFYLLVLYLSALSNTPENPFASIYSDSLIKTACQHLLLLVRFNTLIYRKYYDTPPILMGHQKYFLAPSPGSVAQLKSGIGKGKFYCEYCFYFCLLLYFIMEKSPFGSLFGNTTANVTVVDEPPPAQLDPFKIPMKIVEHVKNNCYSGDGTVHPGDHLLFIYELCELFKCAGISTSKVKRKLFCLSLKGRAAEGYKLLKNGRSIGWEEIVPLFYSKFYPPSEIHKDRNQIYNFWPHDGESIAQVWGRLKSLMLKCPIHELPSNIVINNFYARLSLHEKDLLDASCSGSFTRMKEEVKWDLLDCIQENTEGWENNKGRKSGINYDYECIKSFMGTDDFHNVSVVYGLDSQILANCFKAFASYLDVSKNDWNKYHAPYKDNISCVPARITEVCTVDCILPETYFEKTPFPAKVK